jgi:hypothetical protein
MELDVLVLPLDGEDCPYAANQRAPPSAIHSAASHPSCDPLPMSEKFHWLRVSDDDG